MSTLSPKSHLATWMFGVLAVLVLYVLSWPIIDIKNTSVMHVYGYSLATPHRTIMSRPPWVSTLYRPLYALMDVNGGHNPLAAYWEWWRKRLH